MASPGIIDFATAVATDDVSRPSPDRLLSGDPEQAIRNLFADQTGQFFAGIWSSTQGRWRVSYTENEFCHLLEGVIQITDGQNRVKTFSAGSSFVIPAGFSGVWEVVEPARKLYAIFESR